MKLLHDIHFDLRFISGSMKSTKYNFFDNKYIKIYKNCHKASKIVEIFGICWENVRKNIEKC